MADDNWNSGIGDDIAGGGGGRSEEGRPEDGLTFLPLGGVGEIGMNAMVMQWRGQRWLIDCGVMFPDEETAFADLVLPDLGFIEAHAGTFAGMVLTHGHEDHIGAVPFVQQVRRMPVYGTPFTIELVRRKLEKHGVGGVELLVVGAGETIAPAQSPGIRFTFLHVTHSIPDSAALVIETPLGTVLHTGDLKIDPHPADGPPLDIEAFRQLGEAGVLLMLSDSTNAQVPGRTRGEVDVAEALEAEIRAWPGRVIVAQFASNLHRLLSLERIAERTGRRLCLVGSALHRYTEAARAAGLTSIRQASLVNVDHLHHALPAELLLVLTGSQAESGAALARAAAGNHPQIRIGEEDLVLFSSRVIPGYERRVHRLHGDLARRGATIRHARTRPIHASGHARRDELEELVRLVHPRFFVPVHGEYTYLLDHKELAERTGVVQKVLLIENGEEILVHPTRGLERVALHTLEPYFYDGTATGHAHALRFSDRRRLFHNGYVAADVLFLRDGGPSARVQLRARGLYTDDGRLLDHAADEVAAAVCQLGRHASEDAIEDACEAAVRGFFRKEVGKKPLVDAFVRFEGTP